MFCSTIFHPLAAIVEAGFDANVMVAVVPEREMDGTAIGPIDPEREEVNPNGFLFAFGGGIAPAAKPTSVVTVLGVV